MSGFFHHDMQEVWKVSTTAGSKRVKKGSSVQEASASSSHQAKESEVLPKSSAPVAPFTLISSQSSHHADSTQVSFP